MDRALVRFAFFGSDEFSLGVLEELVRAGLTPSRIVTTPDKPKGRGLRLSPSPLKSWAGANGISLLAPASLTTPPLASHLSPETFDVFIVASYGKILPRELIGLPARGALNVHPSLLPRYRGGTPIEAAILAGDEATGVTIIRMDERVDHGPIVAQKKVPTDPFRETKRELAGRLAREGGALLAGVLPKYLAGEITPEPQDDSRATYTKLFKKEDGEISLGGDARRNFLKIRAFEGFPGAYFFAEHSGRKLRVKVISAHLRGDELVIERVIPEGRHEIGYDEFLRGWR